MASENASDQFNWVAAQATCTAALAFERLRAGVKQDVERRNALTGLDDASRFEFSDQGERFEVAWLEGDRFGTGKVVALVRFEREGRRILAHGEDVDVDITAVMALDAAGQCRFVVGEALYAEWELRRMALEPLLFGEPDAKE